MECLILFNVIPSGLNQVDQSETARIGRSSGDSSNEKDLNISDKILGLLNSTEFLYVFVGFLVVVIICFVCSFHCRQTSSLEHLTDDCDKAPVRSSYKSIRNIRTFFKTTLLNFNNIDEQVAKEQDIKSIDSLTSKNISKSTSASRNRAGKLTQPLPLSHQKSSKSASVISKSDTSSPLRLKINIIKTGGFDHREPKKSKLPSSISSSLLSE